jgi:hypothetical protein
LCSVVEASVDCFGSVVSIGTIENFHFLWTLMGSFKVVCPWHFPYHIWDEKAIRAIIVRWIELVERLEKGLVVCGTYACG